MIKLLVLGGRGYIGKNLLESLPPSFEVIQINNSSINYQILENTNIDIIVNLCASKVTATEQESLKSNYYLQRSIINSLSSKKLKWIQISSYYELQIQYGRSDYYSLHKAMLRDFLKDWSNSNSNFRYSCLFLPHIFGKNESSNRLIPSIRKLNQGEKTLFGSRNQQIPLLHIQDAINSIVLAADINETYLSAPPMWYGKLQTLIEESVKNSEILKLVEYDETKDNYSTKKVKFPRPLYSLKHLLNYEQFKNYLQEGVDL